MDRALKKEFPAVVRLAVFIFVRAIVVVGVQGGAVREAGSEKCAILYLKMRGVPLPFKLTQLASDPPLAVGKRCESGKVWL